MFRMIKFSAGIETSTNPFGVFFFIGLKPMHSISCFIATTVLIEGRHALGTTGRPVGSGAAFHFLQVE
jgi:hypothetical protein